MYNSFPHVVKGFNSSTTQMQLNGTEAQFYHMNYLYCFLLLSSTNTEAVIKVLT